MKKSSVLIVNTVPFRINGMSNIIMNYYRFMDKSDLKFDFVVNSEINDIYKNQLDNNYFLLHNRKKKPFAYIKKLSEIIKKGNYDVVHIHGNSALMQIDLEAIKKSKSDCKVIVHSHNTTCSHMTLHKLLYKRFSKSYDYAIACSDKAGEWLFGNSEYMVLKNAVDTDRFSFNHEARSEFRKKLGISEKTFVAGHVGLFNEQKNHTFLIDIFYELQKKNPDSVLLLLGEGHLQEQIKDKIKQLKIEDKVIFTGNVSDTENYYSVMDAFVMPSLHEGLPLTLVEAQCSGLPCIISDTITKSVNLTKNIEFLSLDDTSVKWADEILKKVNLADRKSYDDEIAKHGYSIKHEAAKLTDFYRKISDK